MILTTLFNVPPKMRDGNGGTKNMCGKRVLFQRAHDIELVRDGLAKGTAQRVVAGRRKFEVARLRITEAGRETCYMMHAQFKPCACRKRVRERSSPACADDD